MIYVAGDFKVNLLDYTTKTFIKITFDYGLICVINKPTRVTRTSATIADHVISKGLS